MSLTHHPWIVTSRRVATWSNSSRAWLERLVMLCVLGLVVGLAWLARNASLGWHLGLGVGVVLLLALLARRGWIILLGPILAFDLRRSARRYRIIAARTLFALALLVLLGVVYTLWLADQGYLENGIVTRDALPTAKMAEFSYSFFAVFMGVQLVTVLLLTPAYVAGAIAEEKELETLPALFTTDLRDREIVFGLLLSRLANLAMILSAGLPILAALQFLGGVEPDLILVGYAFVGLTLMGLAGVSFFFSVQARRPRQAIIRAYVAVAIYFALSALTHFLLLPLLMRATVRTPVAWADYLWLEDIVRALSAGDLFAILDDVIQGLHRDEPLSVLLFDGLRGYAWFNGLVVVVGCIWAVARLRDRGLAGENGATRWGRRSARGWKGLWLLSPPGIGTRPVLWKEMHVESGSHRGWLGMIVVGGFAAALLWPIMQLTYFYGRLPSAGPQDRLLELVNYWVRGLSVVLGCLALLQVAVHAAGRISGERERRTLDGLRVTPLGNRGILLGKWLGSIVSPRGLGTFLALVWLSALILRALHPLAVLCFIGTWLVYAGFAASLGLYFSVLMPTSLRAIFWTLLALIGIGVGWSLAVYDLPEMWLDDFERTCLLPPNMLGLMAFSPANFEHWASPDLAVDFRPILLALAVWAVLGVGLGALSSRFYRRRFGPWIDLERNDPVPPLPAESAGRASAWVRPWLAENLGWSAPWARRLVQLAVVLLPALMVGSRYWQLHQVAEREFLDATAAVTRTDPNWRLDDLEASREPIPDDENSGLLLIEAHGQLPPPRNDDDLHKAFEGLLPERQLNETQINMLRVELGKAKEALITARRLKDRPRGRLPIQWSDDGISTLLPHTQSARTIASLLTNDIRLRLQDGDVDGALESCQAIVNAGRAIGDEPTLISGLVRIAVDHIAIGSLERILAQGQPSEAALASFQQLVEAEQAVPLLLIGMRGERAVMDRLVSTLRGGGMQLSLANLGVRATKKQRWAPVPDAQELSMLLGDSLLIQQVELLRASTALVQTAAAGGRDIEARLGAVMANYQTAQKESLVNMLMPASVKVAFAGRRQQALLACATVALAVERYRAANNLWPDRLDDLVPGYLKVVPVDPFDGQKIRLKRLADGVLIYSTGPDGVDNGGKIDRDQPLALGLDTGLRLWGPAKRRQPAKPALVGPPEDPSW